MTLRRLVVLNRLLSSSIPIFHCYLVLLCCYEQLPSVTLSGVLCCVVLCVSQWELCSLWCELQRDRPELMTVLEDVLAHAVSHLQDSLKERDSLEQALRRFSPSPPLHIIISKSRNFCPTSPRKSFQIVNCSYLHLLCFLLRRETDHDRVVRSLYEEMESQVREEREKRLAQVQIQY